MKRRSVRARIKRRKHVAGEMNQTEAAYASVLFARKAAGEIIDYAFEPERLRLAANTYYVPDFRVLLADGTIEFHEVKACTAAGKMLCEDDAMVKFKVAAETHWMYGFRMCGRLRKSQGWTIVSLNCEDE